ncbi:MAG: sensor domain-containing diguanylate cyclase [Campylobacterota bacterium]|nr:sensor domain-containing diguanylate cyclase [Campylobacterota bacterium]
MYKKVLFSFSITLLLLVLLGVGAIFKMAELANLSQKLYEHPYTVTTATKTVESNIISMHRYMKDVALSTSNEELLLAIQNVNKSELIVYKQFDIIFDKYLGDKKDIQKSYDAFVSWKSIRDEVIHLVQINQKDKAAFVTKNKGAKHIENLNNQVNKLIDCAYSKAIFFNENAKETKKSSILMISTFLIIIFSVIVTILILLVKNIKETDKEIKKHFHLIDQNIMSVTLNKNLKITDTSNAFARHIKFTKKDILNKTDGFLYSDCSLDEQNTIKRVIQSGKNWDGEIKKLDSDGEIKWLHSYVYPVFNDDYEVIGYTNILHDISSQKKIEEISQIDGLTSLFNRRHFDELFPKQIKIAKRNNSLLAFVMMDIDHFKQYNDTYGHQEGDTTLKSVAKLLKTSLKRPDDYTFRLGGEEFGMLYTVSSIEDATNIANTVRENIESLHIAHTGNSASKWVTMSMGLYVIDNNDISDVQEIYKKSDEALYQSKQNGRNQVNLVKL